MEILSILFEVKWINGIIDMVLEGKWINGFKDVVLDCLLEVVWDFVLDWGNW